MEWRNLYRGFLIGTSDLIPGVSGGTIAVMLGMYDELLAAVSGLFGRAWRRHVPFLLPLGIGMAAALFGLSRVIDWLLTRHFGPTQFFFLGLVAGLLPSLWRAADRGRNFGPVHAATGAGAAAVVASMAFVESAGGQAVVSTLTPASAAGLFGAGALASVAMLLPGVSGSFVLLVLGVYPTAIHALSTFNAAVIAVIGSGVVVGFAAGSKLIRHVLARHRDVALAAIIGLIVGSLAVVWPGLPPAAPGPYIASSAAFFAGLGLALRFGQNHGPQV